jgi:hypothetical protein
MATRATLGAVLLATLAGAAEPDGAVAEAFRWTGPRGAASGSFRSRALPIRSEIEEAWRMAFDRVEAAPVHWDGVGYIVGTRAAGTVLVAFDLASGREIARAAIDDFRSGTPLHVWDAMVHYQTGDGALRTYRFADGALHELWAYRGRPGDGGGWRRPRLPVVHENELYCIVRESLVRLAAQRKTPVWSHRLVKRNPQWYARPAVHGERVHVVGIDRKTRRLWIDVVARATGERIGGRVLTTANIDTQARELSVAVHGDTIFIRSGWPLVTQTGTATGVLLPAASLNGGKVGVFSFHLPPVHHPRGTLVLGDGADGREWMLRRGDRFHFLASKARQPDLFTDSVPPTVCGDVACFGSWAADLETRRILWRLPVARVTRPVVPADRLVLVVEDDRVLRAFRGRGK